MSGAATRGKVPTGGSSLRAGKVPGGGPSLRPAPKLADPDPVPASEPARGPAEVPPAPPPAPARVVRVQVNTKLPVDVRDRLDAFVREHGSTVQGVLCAAVVEYMDRRS